MLSGDAEDDSLGKLEVTAVTDAVGAADVDNDVCTEKLELADVDDVAVAVALSLLLS